MNYWELTGAVMREKRVEKGLTQLQVAKAIGVTRTAYTLFELGKRRVNLEEARDLCKLLEVNLEILASSDTGEI